MTKPAESTMTVERLAAVAAHYAPEGLDLEAAMDNVYTNAKGVVMYVPPQDDEPSEATPDEGSGAAPETSEVEESGAGASMAEATQEPAAVATTVGRMPRVVRAVGGTAPPTQKSSDTMSDAELVEAFDQLRTVEIQQMAPA